MCDEHIDIKRNKILPINWLNVKPQAGLLTRNKFTKFSVTYFSGIPGEFKRYFQIKVT